MGWTLAVALEDPQTSYSQIHSSPLQLEALPVAAALVAVEDRKSVV
jgi:hypothetical protein